MSQWPQCMKLNEYNFYVLCQCDASQFYYWVLMCCTCGSLFFVRLSSGIFVHCRLMSERRASCFSLIPSVNYCWGEGVGDSSCSAEHTTQKDRARTGVDLRVLEEGPFPPTRCAFSPAFPPLCSCTNHF